MKAAIRERYGTPETIQIKDLAMPKVGDNDLLVRVHATSVSRTDCALLAAKPFFMRFMTGLLRPKRQVLGTDFTGRVEAVGNAVKDFSVGDAVWGINDLGIQSHAEYVVVSTDDSVARMPEGPGFEGAAACLEGAWYAHSIIERVALESGKRVLINGATGAIGSALLQLCVLRGAH